MKILGVLIAVLLCFNVTAEAKKKKHKKHHGKKVHAASSACVDELGSYKFKVPNTRLKSVCKKHGNERFLECVANSERHLSNFEALTNFCSKKPKEPQLACVKTLAHGGKKIAAKKLVGICSDKRVGSGFDKCISTTKRSFGDMLYAAQFCQANPKPKQLRCVKELASVKRKGKKLVKGMELAKVCKKNYSTAFVECVLEEKNIKSCSKKSSRNVASEE